MKLGQGTQLQRHTLTTTRNIILSTVRKRKPRTQTPHKEKSLIQLRLIFTHTNDSFKNKSPPTSYPTKRKYTFKKKEREMKQHGTKSAHEQRQNQQERFQPNRLHTQKSFFLSIVCNPEFSDIVPRTPYVNVFQQDSFLFVPLHL